MTLRIAALAAVTSVAIWGGLSLQMASGNDPALKPEASAGTDTGSSDASSGEDWGTSESTTEAGSGDTTTYGSGDTSQPSTGSTAPSPVQTTTS